MTDSRCLLHIPFLEPKTPQQEAQNWYEVERWSRQLLHCFAASGGSGETCLPVARYTFDGTESSGYLVLTEAVNASGFTLSSTITLTVPTTGVYLLSVHAEGSAIAEPPGYIAVNLEIGGSSVAFGQTFDGDPSGECGLGVSVDIPSYAISLTAGVTTVRVTQDVCFGSIDTGYITLALIRPATCESEASPT